jgi:hypothetical protein
MVLTISIVNSVKTSSVSSSNHLRWLFCNRQRLAAKYRELYFFIVYMLARVVNRM